MSLWFQNTTIFRWCQLFITIFRCFCLVAQKGVDFIYDSNETKSRIKELCKIRKISMETLLDKCGLGINAIRQINDNKGMSSYSLGKIADYLDCSVDYLLGRTDRPEINK